MAYAVAAVIVGSVLYLAGLVDGAEVLTAQIAFLIIATGCNLLVKSIAPRQGRGRDWRRNPC
jgi:uncharacterized membrane protein HdeD (DUF308 family)